MWHRLKPPLVTDYIAAIDAARGKSVDGLEFGIEGMVEALGPLVVLVSTTLFTDRADSVYRDVGGSPEKGKQALFVIRPRLWPQAGAAAISGPLTSRRRDQWARACGLGKSPQSMSIRSTMTAARH